MKTPSSRLLRSAQWALIAALVVWTGVHTLVVTRTGWSIWRLGGLAMYAEPEHEYRGAAIVACERDGCTEERADTEYFAPLQKWTIPVLLRREQDETQRYELARASKARGGTYLALRLFMVFPSERNAANLLRSTLDDPCGPYLVVHYRQRVSTISREAWVDDRSFVVPLDDDPCTSAQRVAG